jgi:hypothetical protein
MVRRFILIAVLATASAQAELQLTPTLSEYQLEGVKFTRLAFRDGDKTATYQPPRGWDYFGSGDRLTLRPPGRSQAEAIISRVTLTEPSTFGDENLKKLVADAMACAPKGSSGIKIVSQEANPLHINGKETFQFVISYDLQGQTFERSILFLNRDREQLRFQFVALPRDFKELAAVFQSSICSWRNL